MDGGGLVKKIIRNLKTRLYGIILLYAVNMLMLQIYGVPRPEGVHQKLFCLSNILLISECDDRIHLCCYICRIKAKEDSNQYGCQ